MKCPKCGVEAVITKNEYIIKNNNLFRKMTFNCRNKNCDKFKTEIGTDYTKIESTVEE